MTVSEIIKYLGGPAAVSRQLGVRSQAISLWSIKNQIPLERVPALLQVARDRGVVLSAADLRPDYQWQAVCDDSCR